MLALLIEFRFVLLPQSSDGKPHFSEIMIAWALR